MQVMSSPIRFLATLFPFLALGFYWCLFLSEPLEDNSSMNRAWFVMTTLIYPDGYMLDSWTDSGRLPLAFADRLPIIAATIAWLAAATLIGWPWCVQRVASKRPAISMATRCVENSLACLVGLALLSTLTLLVGLAGGLSSRWPLLIGVGALILVSHWSARRWHRAGVEQVWSHETSPVAEAVTLFERVIDNAVIVATIWLGSVLMLGAWVPPREFDVVEYHLQAPKEFYQAGNVHFVPHNIYANMPLGAEMHALAAMTILHHSDTWPGGLIGKSITASISIIGALLLGGWVTLRLGRLCGWTAAGLWLGTPGITYVASLGLIDGVLATYTLATAIVTWRILSNRQPGTAPSGLGLAGLLGGAAAALKYPGLIYVTLPCLLVVAIEIVRAWRVGLTKPALRLSMITLLGLSMTCLPWYAKNWWLAGNPVYPLAANIFGGQTLTPEKIEQWQMAHRVPTAVPADAGWWQQLTGQAQRLGEDVSRVLWASTLVQPAMVVGVVCAVAVLWIGARRNQAVAVRQHVWWYMFAWSMWILLVWWFATHRIDRFWLPITGLWSMLAAWGWWQVRQRSTVLSQTLLLPGLVYAVLICSSPVVSDNRFFVSLAALRDDIGDQDHVPRVPPMLVWINQNLTEPGTRVLLIGEARVFETRFDVIYSTCFDRNPGEAWLAGTDAEKQRAALASEGITHVMIDWSEIERYRGPGNYGFSAWPRASHVEQLVRDGVLEPFPWSQGTGAELFKVLSPSPSFND